MQVIYMLLKRLFNILVYQADVGLTIRVSVIGYISYDSMKNIFIICLHLLYVSP